MSDWRKGWRNKEQVYFCDLDCNINGERIEEPAIYEGKIIQCRKRYDMLILDLEVSWCWCKNKKQKVYSEFLRKRLVPAYLCGRTKKEAVENLFIGFSNILKFHIEGKAEELGLTIEKGLELEK